MLRMAVLALLGAALLAVPLTAPTGAPGAARLPASSGNPVVPFLDLTGLAPASGPHCSNSSFCPAAIRTAYNFTSLLRGATTNGTGQTIVIVDACGDRHLAGDVTAFDAKLGLPAISLNITTLGTGTLCTNGLWSIETSLDVEWAHVVAPGARIDLLQTTSPNASTMYSAWNYSLTSGLGDQISDSWGGNGGCGARIHAQLSRAAAQNVTVLASAGDGAAWGYATGRKLQNPADCGSVLTVGGTTLTLGPRSSYGSETAWYAGGGGYAGGTAEPKYQRTAGIADPPGFLGKPDVAAVANPATGVWIYNSARGGWFVVGGTSVACPLWAGLVADANSLRAANGLSPLGSVDPFLYTQVYGVNGTSSRYAADLHDVRTGNNGWTAGTGWDAATGLGSFDAAPLVAFLGTSPSA